MSGPALWGCRALRLGGPAPGGRVPAKAHTAPWYALAGRAAYPAGAPFLSKKWGKEDQGEGVSSPLGPSSLVGVTLRAVPWLGDGPAAQARQVGSVRACRLGAQGA